MAACSSGSSAAATVRVVVDPLPDAAFAAAGARELDDCPLLA